MVMYKEAMKRDAANKEVNCSKRWPLKAHQDSSKYSQVKNRDFSRIQERKILDLSAINKAKRSKFNPLALFVEYGYNRKNVYHDSIF